MGSSRLAARDSTKIKEISRDKFREKCHAKKRLLQEGHQSKDVVRKILQSRDSDFYEITTSQNTITRGSKRELFGAKGSPKATL